MTDDRGNTNLNLLKQWAHDVVCPVCFAPLRFEAATVVCTGCARNYPIVDGLPVLIAQRAIQPNQSTTK